MSQLQQMFTWRVHGDGRTLAPGEVVRPDERLSWPRTVGLGAQHVIAMFGATFVAPTLMGLNPNLAIMMSGVGTIIFLLVVGNRIPSYLGSSFAFIAAAGAIRADGGTSGQVTGAFLVAGVLLAVLGVVVHRVGGGVVSRVLPPAVTGAVVVVIGLNLAGTAATFYWPSDQWVALLTMVVVLVVSVAGRGFVSRVAILIGLVFGYVLSWVWDKVDLLTVTGADGKVVEQARVSFAGVKAADWIGLPQSFTTGSGATVPGFVAPEFTISFVLLVIPAVIALLAENAGHVKAVGEMTHTDLDPYLGRGYIGDGVATALASGVGGAPTTTYAENIGVMAATRVYSTAAYYVAAVVAILLGLVPKFGALVAAIPNGVLGGITVVLYGMIGLLGAKIWVENRVDFGNPINLVPLAAALILGIGDATLKITDDFSLTGIVLGTITAVGGYHLLRVLAPAPTREALAAHEHAGGAGIVTDSGADADPRAGRPTPDAGSGSGRRAPFGDHSPPRP
ncbi:MAG: solute carrier family 23 protein [Kineosporiaceae bacterium]